MPQQEPSCALAMPSGLSARNLQRHDACAPVPSHRRRTSRRRTCWACARARSSSPCCWAAPRPRSSGRRLHPLHRRVARARPGVPRAHRRDLARHGRPGAPLLPHRQTLIMFLIRNCTLLQNLPRKQIACHGWLMSCATLDIAVHFLCGEAVRCNAMTGTPCMWRGCLWKMIMYRQL